MNFSCYMYIGGGYYYYLVNTYYMSDLQNVYPLGFKLQQTTAQTCTSKIHNIFIALTLIP